MTFERTLVLVKPDGVQRGLIGRIVSRIEETGLKVVGMKLMQVPKSLAEEHYAEHQGKPFFGSLVEYISACPVVALCFQGTGAVSKTRKLMGYRAPGDADPGTIRGDYAIEIGRNLVHGSATVEDAARELSLFFDDEELLDWDRAIDAWVNEQ